MKLNKNIILILLISTLGAFLRFHSLPNNPPGFYSDEASYAYNAYSIIKTGRDEYGKSFPLVFEAFGDYKLPVMLYSIVGSFLVFGVSDMSARIPGALYGIACIPLIYFFTKSIMRARMSKEDDANIIEVIPIVSALFLAISPSHIFVSRGTWELTPAMCFILLGSVMFQKYVLKANSYIYLFISVIAFTLSMYAYNSARIFTPLFILCLIAINRDSLFKSINKSKIIGFVSAAIVGIFLMMPILSTITKPEVVQRAKYISIFYDKGITAKLFDSIRSDEGQQVRITQFFHNKVIYYGMDIARRYLSHFDPNFLFITGDKFEIFKMEGLGFLPLLSLPFMLVGLYSLTNEYEPKVKKTIAAWIFISPLASSLTIFTPSTSRAANLIIPLCIISAIGFKYILEKSEAYKYKFVIIFSVVVMFNVAYIYNQYFIITPKYVAEKWNDGIKDTVEIVSQFQNDYEKVIVSSSQAPSYIFYLWYQKYDPARYQQEAIADNSPDEHGLNFVKSYGKFEFTKSISDVQKYSDKNNKVLFVGFKDELVAPEISIESRNKIKVAEIKF